MVPTVVCSTYENCTPLLVKSTPLFTVISTATCAAVLDEGASQRTRPADSTVAGASCDPKRQPTRALEASVATCVV